MAALVAAYMGAAALLGANPAPEFPSVRGYADNWIGGKRPVTLIGINLSFGVKESI